ncbi:adenine deaminase [Helicovermis profundi]|uniref:Adenine deaminase n=1 Tax=Helicovermis profundi TaxID=3065157 RepID=A0AAU9E0B0_9FIRM|nr:adenine deaminase [Clostridia bacterium S502]
MKNEIKKIIDIASGRNKADLVIKNAKIINVFTEEIIDGDVAISSGKIVGIGEYTGIEEIDLKGKYLAPGLIDAHVHIESSMVTPSQFAKTIIPRGTTTIIADPHEIGNVCGLDGIKYMLDDSKNLPLDVYIMLPSCVPATSFENSGAVLLADDLEKLIDDKRVLGLGELMDYPAVTSAEKNVVDKINLARNRGKIIDGHGPILTEKDLNAYVSAGVKTEHECETVEEMIERLRLGMYVLIREGSAARNLEALVKGVNKENLRRVMFCTDDRHPDDILKDGHIDNNVRLAFRSGIPLISAIKMASLNAAECYRLYDRGAIAPGYKADMIVFSNLNTFKIEKVFKDGKLVAKDGKSLFNVEKTNTSKVTDTVNFIDVTENDLKIKLDTGIARVIKLIPHSLVTESVYRKVVTENGFFKYHSKLDILKLVVIERHHATGNIGLGLAEGFGLMDGAIASTVAHDSHNLIVIGDCDINIVEATKEIKKIGGGIVIVKNGRVIYSLPLAIGGIMSEENIEIVNKKLNDMLEFAYRELNVSKNFDPFMTLAFLALPVIPELKLTDEGLFDVNKFEFTTINVE